VEVLDGILGLVKNKKHQFINEFSYFIIYLFMIKAIAQNYFKTLSENIVYGFATKMQASST
jgi:hypothetical protein